MCVHLCNCKFDDLIFIGVDFKTSGQYLVKGGKYVAGTSFIAFHFTAMTKTNKFNGGDFLQVCTS